MRDAFTSVLAIGITSFFAVSFPTPAHSQACQTLLASTNQGELVEIDLLSGTAGLIGAAPGRGWTDIAMDPAGRLYAVSRQGAEAPSTCFGVYGSGSCSHLYRIDPNTGAEMAHVADLSVTFLSDIDFTTTGILYGNRYVNAKIVGDGGLIVIDPSTGVVMTPPSPNFGPGFAAIDLENGGVAVHPITGELWGVESDFSATPSLFRVDPATGLAAGPALRLGLSGVPTAFGLDGLEILPDGRFLATRGAGSQELYEIDPGPSSLSGLAEIALLPLVFDPAITGTITGLTLRTVPIDLKPGSFPNSVNLGSHGNVPVAILSTEHFDATSVDPLSIGLANATVNLRGNGTPQASMQDVNGDGFLDLVVHVSTAALQLTPSDTVAVVEGCLPGGGSFVGFDSVRVVP